MAGGIGAASFVVAPESTTSLSALAPSVTTFAAFLTGRPLWPSDITGLVLWLPADQIQGIASGASLSNWTDSSASASHATQASAASQPIFVTNVQNGLSAVSFGAAVSQLFASNTSALDVATFVYVVEPSATTTANQRIIGTSAALRSSTVGANYAITNAGTLSDGPISATWKAFIGFSGPTTGSVGTISVSGSITTGTSVGTSVAGAGTTITIGAVNASSQTYSGYIGEVLVYNRNLFEIERSSIESYLRTKWAI